MSRYIALLVNLASLMHRGGGNTSDADAIRDKMEGPWLQMTPDDLRLVDGLSVDLYQHYSSVWEKRLATEEDRRLCGAMTQAYTAKDWRHALELLRECSSLFPRDIVAAIRANAWRSLGEPEIAILFMEEAAVANPTDINHSLLLMDFLAEQTDMTRALELARRYTTQRDTSHPQLLLGAADVMFRAASPLSGKDETTVYRETANLIDYALARSKEVPRTQRADSVTIRGYVELGMCRDHLGAEDLAVQAYDEALRIDPKSEAALVARGILLYGSRTKLALDDFQTAAQQKSVLLWPYFYLAHNAVRDRQFELAAGYCREALAKTPSRKTSAVLLEWQAISAAESGESAATVEALFAEARSLDPSNQMIQQNEAAFRATKQVEHFSWMTEEKEWAQSVGRNEFVPGLAAAA